MKIWLVQGETGEYDSWRVWIVCGYRDQELARRHAEEATHRAAEVKRKGLTSWGDEAECKAIVGPVDPDFQSDYTGTTYEVFEIELRSKLP